MKKKIKVMIFEDRFGVGGIETFICNLCGNIDLNRIEITLVVVNKITNRYDDFFEENGIHIEVLLKEIENSPIKRFQKGLPAFNKYLKTYEGNIIHFNLSNSIDMQYVKIAQKAGIKNRIVHSHNSAATSIIKRVAHCIGKVFWSRSATDYLACSDKAAKWLFPLDVYNKKNYTIIHNAIDAKKYEYNEEVRKKIRREKEWTDKFVVGEVGRFNIQKNHKFLIDIFSEIVKIKSNAILVLVGDGELKKQLQDYVAEKNLDKYVLFYGTSDRIHELLQAFDVFTLPSLYEGLPFVMIEAQAASLPIVASDTITKEANLTKYVKYMPLKECAHDWAETIVKCAEIPRKSEIKKIGMSGFDIKTTAHMIDNIYIKCGEQ